MIGNTSDLENNLIESAISWLRERIPQNWEIERSNEEPLASTGRRIDAVARIRSPNVYGAIAIEAKTSFGPRDVERLFGGIGGVLRTLMPNVAVLVVAPWLSSRTRDLLGAEGVNYIDLTGNALLRLDSPPLFIQTAGAARDPSGGTAGRPRLRGPKAWRLIRTLIDVSPPYGVSDLAAVTQLGPGYVSKILDVLNRELLIERSKRGAVESVDLEGLMRRWAESYEVFRSNNSETFLAGAGVSRVLEKLRGTQTLERTAITGSFAAVRLAPVAAPSLLCVYCEEVAPVALALDLLPTDEGANVVLMSPFDRVVWQRADAEEGITYVFPSQAAIDCLTGNGRMPSEGEALLNWMMENEASWRLRSLSTAE